MDRALADHADDIAGFAQQPHTLADQHLCIPAAHAGEEQKAVAVDVGDHHADLVDVAGQQHAWCACFERCERAAAHIGPDSVGEAGSVLAPQPRGGRLVAGWARGG